MPSQRHITPAGPPGAPAPELASRLGGRAAVTRERLLDAAYDSLLARGVSGTTMADVARRAGISRMTLYRHVEDLPHLIRDLLTRELVAVLDDVPLNAEDITSADDPAEAIAELTAQASARIGRHPLMHRVLQTDPDVLVPLMTTRLGSTQRAALDYLTSAITAAQQARPESLNPGPPGDLALAVLLAAQSHIFTTAMRAQVDPDDRQTGELRAMVAAYLRAPGART